MFLAQSYLLRSVVYGLGRRFNMRKTDAAYLLLALSLSLSPSAIFIHRIRLLWPFVIRCGHSKYIVTGYIASHHIQFEPKFLYYHWRRGKRRELWPTDGYKFKWISAFGQLWLRALVFQWFNAAWRNTHGWKHLYIYEAYGAGGGFASSIKQLFIDLSWHTWSASAQWADIDFIRNVHSNTHMLNAADALAGLFNRVPYFILNTHIRFQQVQACA